MIFCQILSATPKTFFMLFQLIWIAEGKSVELECIYKEYENVGYSCNVLDALLEANDTITIKGLHLNNMSVKDVKSILFYGSTIQPIPKDIFGTFVNMTSLNLENSEISVLNAGDFDGAQKLTDFNGSQNLIRTLSPKTFKNAPNLVNCSLQSNRIVDINKMAFASLKKLELLNLAYNQIKTLQKETFEELLNLKKLYLEWNYIQNLTGLFDLNKKLTHVFLHNNRISTITPNLFIYNINLIHVNLLGNICIYKVFNDPKQINELKSEIEQLEQKSKQEKNETATNCMIQQQEQINVNGTVNHLTQNKPISCAYDIKSGWITLLVVSLPSLGMIFVTIFYAKKIKLFTKKDIDSNEKNTDDDKYCELQMSSV